MDNLTIGEKIRLFRKKANITQLDLELKIDAASGSISHIEKGDTNPSKETLVKIIDALNLSPKDAAFLFDIEIEEEFTKLVNFSKKFNTLNLNEVISNFVNDAVHELSLAHSLLIWMRDGDIFKSTPFTKSWYTDLVLKILPLPLSSVNISLVDPKFEKNIIKRAVIDMKVYESENLSDFGIGILDPGLVNRIQKLMRIKKAAAIPMVVDGVCIGIVAPSWDDESKSQTSLPVLQAFTNHLGTTISNIYKYNALQEELNKFKAN